MLESINTYIYKMMKFLNHVVLRHVTCAANKIFLEQGFIFIKWNGIHTRK